MAQQLRIFDALAQDLGWVLSTYNCPSQGDLVPSSGTGGHQVGTQCTYIHSDKTLRYTNLFLKVFIESDGTVP